MQGHSGHWVGVGRGHRAGAGNAGGYGSTRALQWGLGSEIGPVEGLGSEIGPVEGFRGGF
jgi:hypothetical protein